jgi:putative ABC transport system permease protein
MTQVASASVAMPRLTTTLVGAVAALALIIAIVGIYGVMAYGVGQRTREIGTRIALGAETRDVVLMIVREGSLVAGAGLLAGLAAAYAVTRGLSTLLVGVSAADPVTYGAVAVLILAVTLAASAIPARRAARIDPLAALRME